MASNIFPGPELAYGTLAKYQANVVGAQFTQTNIEKKLKLLKTIFVFFEGVKVFCTFTKCPYIHDIP
jgi:hypothetical protein